MIHSFKPSMIEPTQCAICNRVLLDHSSMAQCESCATHCACELNGSNMLLCPSCFAKHTDALIESVKQSAAQFVARSQEIDNGIKSSNEFFNADTVSICALRDAIMQDESIPAPDRIAAFHSEVKRRIEHFQEFIFKINDNKIDDRALMSFGENLRNMGESIRTEIRERIKSTDDRYVIAKPKAIKVPKVGEKKSPFDLLIEKIAFAKGISKTEAAILVKDKGLM